MCHQCKVLKCVFQCKDKTNLMYYWLYNVSERYASFNQIKNIPNEEVNLIQVTTSIIDLSFKFLDFMITYTYFQCEVYILNKSKTCFI